MDLKVMHDDGGRKAPASSHTMVTPFDIDHTQYSSMTGLLQVTAWCQRFVNNIKSSVRKNQSKFQIPLRLTKLEIDEAKQKWEQCIQQHWYPGAIQSLKGMKFNSFCKQLGLELDINGIIRSGAHCDVQFIEPKLLPRDDHYTQLVIQKVHKENLHPDIHQTLQMVRKEYWIPKGYQKVQMVLKCCKLCLNNN